MADFVGHELFDKRRAKVRHGEHALVDHDQSAAFVAVPAEIGFGNGELGVGKGPEPLTVDGDRLANRADHLAGEVGVLGEGDAAYLNGPRLAEKFLITGAAQESEIA